MFNEDKSLVLVFNGEIYNFAELKDTLTEKGHIFKSAETAKSRKMYNPQTGKTRSTKVHLIDKYISKGWILGGKPD